MACSSALEREASVRGQAELRCPASALRRQRVGTLRVQPQAPIEVALYDVAGCDDQRQYWCAIDRGRAACEPIERTLLSEQLHAPLEQARRLLRSSTRARCPGTELTVIQESASLYRFESCDGEWLYHCRSGRCDRL